MKRISEIKGYENIGDYYYVTTCGRIISTYGGKPKLLKLQTNSRGYKAYTFGMKQGKQKTKEIHRIVAIAFIENNNNLPVVDHIDGNKGNPISLNLRWLSHSENHIEAIKLSGKGVFKLTIEDVKEIRTLKEKEAVEKFNIHRSTYYKIKRGEIYKYIK